MIATRLYRIVLFIGLGGIWLFGWDQYAPYSKPVLSGLLITGYVPCMWFDAIKVQGRPSIATELLMVRVFIASKRGELLTAIAVLSILYWYSPFWASAPISRLPIVISTIIVIILMWLQPPFLFVLGESNPRCGQVLSKVSLAAAPLRVIAMLDLVRTGRSHTFFSPFTDDLRIVASHGWENTVLRLCDLVPHILLDARTDSPVVVGEATRVLEDPYRTAHTWFLTEDDGSAPALTLALAVIVTKLGSCPSGINRARVDELDAIVTSWIVDQRRGGHMLTLTSGPVSLEIPDDWEPRNQNRFADDDTLIAVKYWKKKWPKMEVTLTGPVSSADPKESRRYAHYFVKKHHYKMLGEQFLQVDGHDAYQFCYQVRTILLKRLCMCKVVVVVDGQEYLIQLASRKPTVDGPVFGQIVQSVVFDKSGIKVRSSSLG